METTAIHRGKGNRRQLRAEGNLCRREEWEGKTQRNEAEKRKQKAMKMNKQWMNMR